MDWLTLGVIAATAWIAFEGRRGANAAIKNEVAVNRPTLVPVRSSEHGSTAAAHPLALKNIGRTPAFNIRGRLWASGYATGDEQIVPVNKQAIFRVALEPGGELFVANLAFLQGEFPNGVHRPFVLEVRYSDVGSQRLRTHAQFVIAPNNGGVLGMVHPELRLDHIVFDSGKLALSWIDWIRYWLITRPEQGRWFTQDVTLTPGDTWRQFERYWWQNRGAKIVF